MKKYLTRAGCATALSLILTITARAAGTGEIRPAWDIPKGEVKTALTIHVCPEAPLLRGSPIHDQLFQNLRDMSSDYARLQPWAPYPRLAIPELEPPANGKTSWDFSHIDPVVADFFEATKGRRVMLNFGDLPEWLFADVAQRTPVPADPGVIVWDYGKGHKLRDPTLKELKDYYVRLASWYIKGGFTDELGKRHESGHHYKIAYWEVLNEVDIGNGFTPEEYTRIYDEIVLALKPLDPQMKFSGLVMAYPWRRPEWFHYFSNPRNHKPGVPLDMISYHFYAQPEVDESPEIQEHTFFNQADRLLATANYVDVIRKHYSPNTEVYINELASTTADSLITDPNLIPNSYWNLSGSMFAYIYLRVGQLDLGIHAIAGAELIDYPGQYPAATLSDWNTGKPNARYRVLKLLSDGIDVGDRLVDTLHKNPEVYAAQAYLSKSGQRKILIVNKRNRPLQLQIAEGVGAQVDYVDQVTGANPPGRKTLDSDQLTLEGYGVAIVSWAKHGAIASRN